VSGACRPTGAEPTSSSRPASSSARVCLTTMKIVSRTAKAAPHTPHRAARKAPTEVPSSRPKRNRSAGFALAFVATASRLAAVGYSTLRSRAVMASSAAMPKTHAGSTTQSRRKASLLSCPVPAKPVITGSRLGTALVNSGGGRVSSRVGGRQVNDRMPAWCRRPITSSRAARSTRQRTTVPVTASSCTPGIPSSVAGAPSSASTEILVRCRISASVPVSAVLPWRMIVTRSDSASASDRM